MTKCSVCGRKLDGVELMENIPWTCAECAGDATNAAHCVRGDKIRYVFPTRGSMAVQLMGKRYLAPGDTYVVDTVRSGRNCCHIKVQGLKYWFNSVLFERVVE